MSETFRRIQRPNKKTSLDATIDRFAKEHGLSAEPHFFETMTNFRDFLRGHKNVFFE